VVELMLAAEQPVYVAWGPSLISLHNDGYIPILGTKHPGALGKLYVELWAEIWDEYRPIVEATMAGEAQHFVDRPVALAGRPGLPVGWFTFSWTPLRDETGAVAGFFCAATETTGKVRAEEALRESKEKEAALRESEARYRAPFRAMDEGYLLAAMLFDGQGRPVDIRYTEANPAAIRMLGGRPHGPASERDRPDYQPHWTRSGAASPARAGAANPQAPVRPDGRSLRVPPGAPRA
jgi:PAS domain-containing protein